MIDVMDDKDIYLANFAEFEKKLGAGNKSVLHRLRQAAIERFEERGLPTLADEEWRFTPLASLGKVPYKSAEKEAVALATLKRACFWFEPCNRVVFVNGFHAPELSSVTKLPEGTAIGSLAEVLRNNSKVVEPHLASHADYQDQAFTALNTAFIQDGAFVSIPKGTVVSEPIHLIFVSTTRGEPTVSHPRNLILAGVNSQATIIESYVGFDKDVYFTNAVTEIVAGENAMVDHYKIQRESEDAFHIATLQIHQERNGKFSTHSIALGGGLVRNEVNALMNGEGCECTLNGLYLGKNRQLIDNHTRIEHAKPHCASHELYKGILDGKAHGVFSGKIHVHPDAQKTDAKQTNKTLLLSQDAVINSKPQLEIYADDVKCTHGATIGQLAEEAIFYLRSRGLGKEEARGLLTFAFANDIVSRVKVEDLRRQLEDHLLAGQARPGLAEAIP